MNERFDTIAKENEKLPDIPIEENEDTACCLHQQLLASLPLLKWIDTSKYRQR